MRATKRAAILLILPLMIIGLIACGTDSDEVASEGVGSSVGASSVIAVDDDHSDDEADHVDDAVLATHNEDPHDEAISETHEDEATEAEEHGHATMNMVDPDAPVMHVYGTEFGYESVTTEVEADHPFTIMFHNEGNVEHDITFEGMESMGGIHLQPGEDGKATFSINETGDYSYYCTVPGHHEAGMASTLAVMTSSDGEDGHHDETAEVMHEETDGHDDEVDEAAHEEVDGHDDAAAGA